MFCNPIFAKLFLIKNVTNICQTTEQLIELMNRRTIIDIKWYEIAIKFFLQH